MLQSEERYMEDFYGMKLSKAYNSVSEEFPDKKNFQTTEPYSEWMEQKNQRGSSAFSKMSFHFNYQSWPVDGQLYQGCTTYGS